MDMVDALEPLDMAFWLPLVAVVYGMVALGVVLFHVTTWLTEWLRRPRKEPPPPSSVPPSKQERFAEIIRERDDERRLINDSGLTDGEKAAAHAAVEEKCAWKLYEFFQ